MQSFNSFDYCYSKGSIFAWQVFVCTCKYSCVHLDDSENAIYRDELQINKFYKILNCDMA